FLRAARPPPRVRREKGRGGHRRVAPTGQTGQSGRGGRHAPRPLTPRQTAVRLRLNSEVSPEVRLVAVLPPGTAVAVAEMTRPGAPPNGRTTPNEALPLTSVVTAVKPRKDCPWPWPLGSAWELAKNSMR